MSAIDVLTAHHPVLLYLDRFPPHSNMSAQPGQPSQEQMVAMQNEQMKDFLKSYNKTTQLCFNDCVRNFTTADLTEGETTCGQKCVSKYLEYSARVAQQFIKRNNPQ